ncbi:MAG: cytochrome C, partial [Myxococcales bacterium]|nr:cytochrome C [Myxococcales bacterium]
MSLSTLVAFAGCASDELTQVPETGEASQALGCDEGPPAVGLALEIENGAGVPLKVKKGQRFYVNQLDMRAFVNTTVDQGVAALDTTGDFASLGWQGNQLVDQEFVLLSNPDGTFTRRRFYRGAKWMEQDNTFIVRQETATGAPLGPPVVLKAGKDDKRRDSDDFFARRYGAIQWTYDCPTATNCSGAHTFQEEALVELRYTRS